MSKWTYARIDRNELGQVHCVFCNRPLRSGRLIVLRDDSGVEAYAGPSCAKTHVGAPTEPILDLSRMAMLLVVRGEPPVRGGANSDPDDDPLRTEPLRSRHGVKAEPDEVADYLRLRVEHMQGFSGNATHTLREYHRQLSSETGLERDARVYVERLLAKSKNANTIFSYRNVERCIGAAHWLRVAIENTKPDRREFLEQLLSSLQEYWRLTSKQIDALNRWGEGVRKTIKDYPILDAGAFNGVQSPRQAKSQNSSS
jgi:hypothetical protein